MRRVLLAVVLVAAVVTTARLAWTLPAPGKPARVERLVPEGDAPDGLCLAIPGNDWAGERIDQILIFECDAPFAYDDEVFSR